jgi:O-antigen/teichoic acid export membrane protein
MVSRVEISKRLVLVNTASGILAKTINVSVVLWLHQYLLRRISPEEYSLLPLLMSIIVLLPLVTSILTAGLGRFVLTAYARLMMALLVFSAALKPPCTAFSVGFYVQQKFVWYNLLGVGNELLRLSLLCILLLGLGARVLWVVVANVAAELVLTTATLTLSRRMVPALRFRVREIRWARTWELMSFGGWSFLGNIAYRLREMIVLFILNRSAPMEVAVFSVGSLGRRQIDTWTDVMAGPLYPVVTGMHALGAKERIRNVYLRGGRIALWIMLLVGLPAALFAQPIIRLYAGNTYMEAAVVMVLTLASLPLTGGTWMIWQVANATGRVRPTGVYILVTQALIVALTVYAVSVLEWGASGVALARFLVFLVSSFLLTWPLALNLADVKFGRWVRQTLIPGLTPGCAASVVWTALGLLLEPDSWLEMGVCVGGGIVCYLVVLVKFSLELQDRQDLAVALGKGRALIRRQPAPGPVELAEPDADQSHGATIIKDGSNVVYDTGTARPRRATGRLWAKD